MTTVNGKSLEKAKNQAVAMQLLREMQKSKFNYHPGSWTTDMEYNIWAKRGKKLDQLATDAGGWWWSGPRSSDERVGVVFLPHSKWLGLNSAYWAYKDATHTMLLAEKRYVKLIDDKTRYDHLREVR